MHESAIEPLQADVWIGSFARLADRLRASTSANCSPFVRQTYHLLLLAPECLRSAFAPPLPEDEFEALLELSEAKAAEALLGSTVGWRLEGNRAKFHGLTDFADDQELANFNLVDLRSARSIVLGICSLVQSLPVHAYEPAKSSSSRPA